MGRLGGKAVLINGAGQGIGLGIARLFAQEGANLVITGRVPEKLEIAAAKLQSSGAGVVVCPGDAGIRIPKVSTAWLAKSRRRFMKRSATTRQSLSWGSNAARMYRI